VSTEELGRREALLRAGRLVAGATLLGAAGCGSGPGEGPQARDVARRSIAIDYASFYAPIEDLRRLVQERAKRRGALVLFSADPSGVAVQRTSLRKLTGETGGFRVVVVAAFDAAAVAPIVAAAVDRDVKVVSYVTPLAGQTAAISVDGAGAAGLLAADARAWAAANDARSALVVAPPERSPVPDPFLPYASGASRALVEALADGPLRVAATTRALGAPDGEQVVRAVRREHPNVDVVLTWNDATALGAAQALPRGGYVGALGAPAITGPAVFEALAGLGPLRCLVAPRLSQLADALVDLPLDLAQGGQARDRVVPLRVFHRRTDAARAALGDYAAG